ncbi:flagellum-specific ATP synthase [Desulfosarcina sp. BuS5]|uniref:flagellar protein export ATPase FliI n=1 Tax=Desulfosarcina sp. BuS5 TaxID=933262 RepID=UPI000489A6EA|nr:flagellar protein export ATPase FliI [Desulfosarcina sp. BuS5]WDN90045.1 flagellum-specific ATP synthase [Desulfosarcina sp. BuS5]
MNPAIDFNKYYTMLDALRSISATGKVVEVTGLVTEARGPASMIGSICEIYTKENEKKIRAEVLGFRGNRILLMPLDDVRGVGPGSRVVAKEQKSLIAVGNDLLGRVIDGLGNPLDNKGMIRTDDKYPVYAEPLNPLDRSRIKKPLDIGIRAVNGLLTIGCGQRLGIFAGSGVGKSVLLGMIARNTSADINVIALIGERGREVNEFIDKELGEEGLKKSVVVVATSDRFPLIRIRGAFIATAIAEYFRDQGQHVNLMMDSVTRFAMAQREIGLALGEPPTTKGYTPSVFTMLPKLLERAGTSPGRGTITGLYTVLVEGDDMNDPIADSVRSILDGHIVLSRDLAMHNHYPPVDILKSISRVMIDITDSEHQKCSDKLKSVLSTYKKAEDLINIGAYVSGSNQDIDYAIDMIEKINAFLVQGIGERFDYEDSIRELKNLLLFDGSQ